MRYAREKVAAYRAFPYEIFSNSERTEIALIRNGEEFLASPAARTARSMENSIATLERQQQLLRQLRRFRPW